MLALPLLVEQRQSLGLDGAGEIGAARRRTAAGKDRGLFAGDAAEHREFGQ